MAGLSLATRGTGGPRLVRHLLNAHDNEVVQHRPGRGLIADDLLGQINEIRVLGRGAQTTRTLLHINLNPSIQLTPEQREEFESRWWAAMESEFGLQEAAYAEVRHLKHSRWHTHRAYDATSGGLRLVNISHDFARRQRISAEVAYEMGLDCPPIAHPRKVIRALEKMGRPEIAQHVRDTWRKEERLAAAIASSSQGTPPVPVSAEAADFIAAPISPRERMQEKRTGVKKADVQGSVLAAWNASASGPGDALIVALAEKGLGLALENEGTKGREPVPIVVDHTGNTHSLSRLLSSASKKAGGKEGRISAADVRVRLEGVALPTIQAVRDRMVPVEAPPVSIPAVALPPELVEASDSIRVVLPEIIADTPAPAEEVLGIAEIAEFIEAYEARQKQLEAEAKAKAKILAAARESQETENRSRQVEVVAPPPIIIRQPMSPVPGIQIQPQRQNASSPYALRRAAVERVERRWAALLAEYNAADQALTPALRASNLAWVAYQDANKAASEAAKRAGAAWARAKLKPLEENEKQAEAAYTRAVAELQRHDDSATGVNSWKKVSVLDRAWTQTRTRLQSVVDTAREALEEAKAAIRSLRTWLTTPVAQKKRGAIEAAASEKILLPLREEAMALDTEKDLAKAKADQSLVALEAMREERNLALRRFRAAEAQIYAAQVDPSLIKKEDQDNADIDDKPTS